jgi:hypothetical protein
MELRGRGIAAGNKSSCGPICHIVSTEVCTFIDIPRLPYKIKRNIV